MKNVKFLKATSIFLKIFQIICVMSIVLFIFAFFILLFQGENNKIITFLNFSNNHDLRLKLSTIFKYSFIVLVYFFGANSLQKICDTIVNTNPFNNIVVAEMKKISLIVLLYGLINIIFDSFYLNFVNIVNRSNNGYSITMSTKGYLNINFLIIFFVVIILKNIFEYGCKLQQLSDETV